MVFYKVTRKTSYKNYKILIKSNSYKQTVANLAADFFNVGESIDFSSLLGFEGILSAFGDLALLSENIPD